jgi:uncharacterized alpha-E superfamily protein
MLSRTADHLDRMARYVERAGQVAQRPAAKPEQRDARRRVRRVLGLMEVIHAV